MPSIWSICFVIASCENVLAQKTTVQPPNIETQAEDVLKILQCQLDQAEGDATGKAEKCLKDAGVKPVTAIDWNNQGWSRLRQGRVEEAINDFSRALQIEPSYEKARINKANALTSIGMVTEAINEVDILLKSNPDSFAGLENRCTLLDRADRAEEALEVCDKAVKKYPLMYASHNNYGWVYWGIQHYKEAAKEFSAAIEIDPSDTTALGNLLGVFPWVEPKSILLPTLENFASKGLAYHQAFNALFTAFVKAGSLPDQAFQLGLEVQKTSSGDKKLAMSLAWAAAERHDAIMTSQQVKRLLATLTDDERRAFSPMTSKQTARVRMSIPKGTSGSYVADTDLVACYVETLQHDESQSFLDADRFEAFKKGPFGSVVATMATKRLPTRYEDPAPYIILENLTKDIEAAIRKNGSNKAFPRLFFGTLDSTDVNAEAKIVPNGWTCSHPEATASVYDRRVILVNWRTFDFAYVMTKLLTKTVALSEPDGRFLITSDHATYRLFRKNPNLVDDYEALVDAVLMIANVRPDVSVDMRLAHIIEPVTNAAELFVVAHEYGHVLLGHDLSISGENVDARQREWRQELEADLFAYQTLAAIAKEKAFEGLASARAIYLLAPVLFLREMELMEEADNLLGGRHLETAANDKARLIEYVATHLKDPSGAAASGDPEVEAQILASDHPPLWLRRALLQKVVVDELKNDKPGEQDNDITSLLLTLMDHLDLLYDVTKPRFATGAALAEVQAFIDREVKSKD